MAENPVPPGSVVVEPEPTPTPVPSPTEPETLDPATVDLKDEVKVRGLLGEVTRLRGVVRDLKPKAERVDQIETWARERQPYITVLEQHPELIQRALEPPAPVAGPQDDPQALEIAKQLDFYTATGQPDVARGAAHLALVRKEARAIAQETFAPVETGTLQERSDQNFYRALQIKTPGGEQPSEQAVRAIWQQVLSDPGGLRITSDPRAASFLAMAAIGMDRLLAKPGAPGPAPEAPLLTEPSGGGGPTATTVTELGQRIATNRGKTTTEWAAHQKGYRPGRPTVLED